MITEREDGHLWNNFLTIFCWKKPLFYIFIFVAIGIYYYIFIINFTEENFGFMEISKSIRFLTIAFFTFFVGIPFVIDIPFRKIRSKFIRFFILAVIIFLTSLIISFLSWEYYIYDNKQLNSYKKILPLKISPNYQNRETLIFNDIKEVKIFGSGESASQGFIMYNDKRYHLDLKNFTYRSKGIFLANLYYECEWLRESIEKTYGSIERIENGIEYYSIYRFNIAHFLAFVIIIWMIMAYSTILIIYTNDPKLKL
jgi:hypothetical protein